MKKSFLVALILSAFISGKSQNGNNICVYNALSNYMTGGGASELERGIKCSNEAVANEATANDKKTWFYRGQLYTEVAQDTVLNKTYAMAALDAVTAFKKLDDLNDPKFKDWDEVWKYLIPLGTMVFNHGVDAFKDKNYALAFKFFYSVKDINAVFADRKKTPNVELVTALKNAALSAENANDTKDAIKVYEEWIALSPTANAYFNYSIGLRKSGDTAKAIKAVDEGLAKFPGDANLLGAKINSYIEVNDFPGAIGYLSKLIAITPDNDRALFAMGKAYASSNKEDSAIYYFTQAHAVNPKNADALTQIGDIYLTRGNAFTEDMNKLGNSQEDIKKYNELKAKRKTLYLQAKPYFDDALKLTPDDPEVKRISAKLNALTAE